FESMAGSMGIAHTRWATHGGVTRENAHPHADCSGAIAIVHNGIIENFQELKAELAAKGHSFKSETDSEVIAHLIEDNYKGDLEKAAFEAAKRLRGSFAVLAVSAKEPGKIVCFKRESPLLVGLGNGEMFAASDATPIVEYTRRVVFLEDGEAAALTKDSAKFYSLDDWKPLEKKASTVEWSAEDAGKNGYSHFMLKEIFEQPQALKAVIAQDEKNLAAFAEELKKAKRVIAVACGTARHSAVIGKHMLDRVAGKDIEVLIASEFEYFADRVEPGTIVLAVSQSGETADVLDGLRRSKAKGARIMSIVNVKGSSIDRLSERSLYLNCGPEIAVASTKAFMAQCAVFYLLAHAMAGKLEKAEGDLRLLSGLVQQELDAANGKMKEIGEELAKKQNAYYLGRGVNYAIALEGALKLKEISYVHAEGMPAGELKHGTLALIEKGTPVFLLNPEDYTYYESLSNGIETRARGAKLFGLSNKENKAYDEWIRLPETIDALLYPFLSIVPLQLIAYYAAVARGNDPDKPRNLAKSVTVK
ncbi:glutamine--fructose-6-phosphate transaminase (isomerizing), partial [Candidatus Micrarchaeota archaeon CG_4_10_14_0_8_um_filter_60_7]